MKSLGIMLSVVLMSLCSVAFAQTMQKTDLQKSDAQKSFDQLKTLAGSWQASVTTDPPQHEMGNGTVGLVSLRVTSRGNALVHEMQEMGKPDDPTRYDHPVTMLYLDGDRLLLTHYCDAGNRPRMVARTSPDGKMVEFDFLDVAGSTGGIRFSRRCREHAVRAHAPCGLHHHRRQPSHRGLDLYDARG